MSSTQSSASEPTGESTGLPAGWIDPFPHDDAAYHPHGHGNALVKVPPVAPES